MALISFWSLLFFCITCSKSTPLQCHKTEQNVNGCCFGYRWDRLKGHCVECILGYTGPECTLKCPYPLFGKHCQKLCNCPTTKCNFQSGCLNAKTEVSTAYYLSTTSNDNFERQPVSFGKEDILGYVETVDQSTKDRMQTIWRIIVAMLAVLTILTTAYVGKCVFRIWKSRTTQFNINTVPSETFTTNDNGDQLQRPNIYELADNRTGDMLTPPYDEIHVPSTLSTQIIRQDKALEEIVTDTSSSVSTEQALNDDKDEIQSNVPEIEGAYITACM